MYGIPHGRGANLLVRTDKVKPAPDSWSAVFDDASKYKGKVTAYDSPIYIADAAVYLMATQPDLKIKDPYALDEKKLDAAVPLLKKQSQNVGLLGRLPQPDPGVQERLQRGWYHLAGDREPRKEREGAGRVGAAEGRRDRLVRHLDGGREERAQDLRLQADRPPGLAEDQRRDRGVLRRGARQQARLQETSDPKRCEIYHADDEEYFSNVYYWNTPISACLDGASVKCTDYAEWTKRWSEIRG